MKPKYVLRYLLIFSVLLPCLSAASNWVPIVLTQLNRTGWYFDKDSIVYFKDKNVVGIDLLIKDKNYQRMWIKSSGVNGDKLYQVEISCKEHSARLQDDSGKVLYSEPSMDYLYDKPILPDTVLDLLHKAVCK